MVVVLEWFAGIGGFRQAYEDAVEHLNVESCKTNSFIAIESSAFLEEIYRFNWFSGGVDHIETNENMHIGDNKDEFKRLNIQNVKLAMIEELKAKVWTLSPPCQPFSTTKDAKRLCKADHRNDAFERVMDVLINLKERPEFIFLENVKGFYESQPYHKFIHVLKSLGYEWRQYILSPIQFQIPNQRSRFYMCIRRKKREEENKRFCGINFSQNSKQIFNRVDSQAYQGCITRYQVSDNISLDCSFLETIQPPYFQLDFENLPINELKNYLVSFENEKAPEALLLADKVLDKPFAKWLSYVGKNDKSTYCFTSSYHKTVNKSSGSLLHIEISRGSDIPDVNVNDQTTKAGVKNPRAGDQEAGSIMDKIDLNHLKNKVRFFAPRELLNIFGFRSSFNFPSNIPLRQQYKAIGQSLNVIVVRAIIFETLWATVTKSEPTPGAATFFHCSDITELEHSRRFM
uniref:DNA (cytosine-5-)-methyltransferase n=1 Tax=Aplanochytrium stocchinoi TaxID=215587 RepID=A0A7S3PQ93_9STRA